jgi:hypothetical protein
LGSCGVERNQRHDNLIEVVIEGAEKLSAKKSEETNLFECADVSSVCHGGLPRVIGYFSAKFGNNASVMSRPEFLD